MTDLQTEISSVLYEKRIELRWTQVDLAIRAGIGPRDVRRVESCEAVSWAKVERIARALGLQVKVVPR